MSRPRTILLVEDSPSDADLIRIGLEESGVANALTLARDGQEALDYLFGEGAHKGRDVNELPAVMLLDLHLPKIEGLDVLRRVRTDKRTKLLPVVILTSSDEDKDRITGYDLGANAYVRKPVNFTEFAKAIKVLGLFWLVVNEPPKA